MLAVKVSREFLVQGANNLDALTDQVMEELLSLEGSTISESDVTAELSSSQVTISVIAQAISFDEAVLQGDSAIRTAIHASGGHTPQWGNASFEIKRSGAELISA